MKVLQINVVYGRGSTGKITADLHHLLMNEGHQSYVCYGRKAAPASPGIIKVSSEWEAKLHALSARLGALPYGGSPLATGRLLSLLKKLRPDVVHLQCINGYFVNIFRLMGFLKKNKIPTVLTLHAEFMYTGGCGHALECGRWKSGCGHCPQLREATASVLLDNTSRGWRHMKKAFDHFDTLRIVSVSEWLEERAKQSPMLHDKPFSVVYNGLDTSVFCIRDDAALRRKHAITSEKIVLFVTPSYTSEIKGGKYVTALARRLEPRQVKVVVVGYNGDGQALPANMITVEHTNNQQELAQYYSMADVTVLASRRETFSMVVAESLCCGTPVVGFKAGAPERIAINDYSEFCEYGSVEKLQDLVIKWLPFKKPNTEQIALRAQPLYSKETMAKGYFDIYEQLYSSSR